MTGLLALLFLLTAGLLDCRAERACVDDSDCAVLGHRFACYHYSCITAAGRPACGPAGECGPGAACWAGPEGVAVCLPALSVCSAHLDCTAGRERCCGTACCPASIFLQWTQFPCVTDGQCEAWNTGGRCCPDTQRCCPLAPPTTTPTSPPPTRPTTATPDQLLTLPLVTGAGVACPAGSVFTVMLVLLFL